MMVEVFCLSQFTLLTHLETSRRLHVRDPLMLPTFNRALLFPHPPTFINRQFEHSDRLEARMHQHNDPALLLPPRSENASFQRQRPAHATWICTARKTKRKSSVELMPCYGETRSPSMWTHLARRIVRERISMMTDLRFHECVR